MACAGLASLWVVCRQQAVNTLQVAGSELRYLFCLPPATVACLQVELLGVKGK